MLHKGRDDLKVVDDEGGAVGDGESVAGASVALFGAPFPGHTQTRALELGRTGHNLHQTHGQMGHNHALASGKRQLAAVLQRSGSARRNKSGRSLIHTQRKKVFFFKKKNTHADWRRTLGSSFASAES